MKINVVYNKNIDGFKEALSKVEELLIKNKVDFQSFDIEALDFLEKFRL